MAVAIDTAFEDIVANVLILMQTPPEVLDMSYSFINIIYEQIPGSGKHDGQSIYKSFGRQ